MTLLMLVSVFNYLNDAFLLVLNCTKKLNVLTFSLECDIGTDECVQLCDTFLDSIEKFQELYKIVQS